MMKTKKILNFSISVFFMLSACGEEFLDIKRNSNQVVPNQVEDYQAILDVLTIMNRTSMFLNLAGSDEYTTKDDFISAMGEINSWQRKAYTWQTEIFNREDEVMDWNNTYERILYANLALDVERVAITDPTKKADANSVAAQARFHRAWNYYQLATTFCEAYDPKIASSQLGLPLRTDYDVTEKLARSSLKETYALIEQDLLFAKEFLNEVTANKFRIGKLACLSLLSKVYLEMEEYDKALEYASLVLTSDDTLLDYNNLNMSKRYTFSDYSYGSNNPEVMTFFHNVTSPIIAYSRHDLKSTLYPLYQIYDLRREAFFNNETDGRLSFKGSYMGSSAYFTGIGKSEIFLIVAECYARAGDRSLASQFLNRLLEKRYSKDHFSSVDFTDSDEETMLKRIVLERQKELCWRGIRWVDLKRYNKDVRLEKALNRTMFGEEYDLQPRDPKWIWPIPHNEITSGNAVQNPR